MGEPRQLGKGMGDLMARIGISQAQVNEAERGEHWMACAAFDRRALIDPERHADAASEHASCSGTIRIEARSGRWLHMRCDACGLTFAAVVAVVAQAREQARHFERAHLPSRFRGVPVPRSPESAHVRAVLREWARQPGSPSPALWGKPGRGKTHLLTALGEALIRRGNSVAYWTFPALLDDMRAEFGEQGEGRTWGRALSAEVLILDDPGAEREGAWQSERFERLVDHRYLNRSPIVLATNFAPERWESVFGSRAASRLAELTRGLRMELGGRDWRQAELSGGGAELCR